MRAEHGICYVVIPALPPSMFSATLLIAGCALLGLGLLGTVMLLWASWHAPEGYEDEQGFSLANSPSSRSSSPVTSPATTTGVTPGGEVISRLATTTR